MARAVQQYGGCLYGKRTIRKARLALEAALKTHPSYATAHQNLGGLYAKMASDVYDKALQVDRVKAALAPKLALIEEIAPM
jgi:Tfp pilus assembly protein PilF